MTKNAPIVLYAIIALAIIALGLPGSRRENQRPPVDGSKIADVRPSPPPIDRGWLHSEDADAERTRLLDLIEDLEPLETRPPPDARRSLHYEYRGSAQFVRNPASGKLHLVRPTDYWDEKRLLENSRRDPASVEIGTMIAAIDGTLYVWDGSRWEITEDHRDDFRRKYEAFHNTGPR